MVDVFSHKYVFLNTMNIRLLGFKYVKELYANDCNFAEMYNAYELLDFSKSYWMDDYLFKENKLCIPDSSMRELLVREAHGGK